MSSDATPAHGNVALQTAALCKKFGALSVTSSVDFMLPRGARHALIGPNGAGKTTFINLLTGILAPDSGRIFIDGSDVTSMGLAARVKRGLVRTFQITSLFTGLSVVDNVALAIAERQGASWNMFNRKSAYSDLTEEALEILDSLGLAGEARRRVDLLPYGHQRLVEIAIALGTRPRVLLLDEPAAGVPSSESHIILDVLARLPSDVAILIIEHDMELVFRFAERISVLVNGEIVVEGGPDEISRNDRVRQVYLGDGHRG